MKQNNRIVFNFSKVMYGKFRYRNQWDQLTPVKPVKPTVYGHTVSDLDFAPEVAGWPKETMLDRAKRRKLLDVWTPECVLQLSANHSLLYTGDKAVAIWKEWCRLQFKKK